MDEQRHLWDRLDVVIQGGLPLKDHERVSFRDTRHDPLVSGVLLRSA